MTEIPDFAERVDWHGNANVLNESEQEAIDYYIAEGGRQVKREYQDLERRSIGSQLDRQMSVQLGFKYSRAGPEVANRLTKHFKDYAPMSFQEGIILMEGVGRRFEKILRMPADKLDGAVKGQYNTLVKYLSDAAQDKHVLDQALVENETGPPQSNVDLVRTTPSIHEAITKQLMARGFLWQKYDKAWPNHTTNAYKERHKYWLGFTLAASKFASDESVSELYEFASKRANLRFKNLFGQVSYLEAQPIIKKLRNEGKIAPINFSQLWQYKIDQDVEAVDEKEIEPGSWRDLKVPETVGHLVTAESVATALSDNIQGTSEVAGERQPVKDILAKHELVELEKGELRGKLEDRNWQPGWIDREINSAPDPEKEERKNNARARFIKRLQKPMKSKSTYKRGRPETGPSDKRVETD